MLKTSRSLTPKLTPGAIRHDLSKKEICATKWGKDQRYVTEKMKREVYHAYAHLMPRPQNVDRSRPAPAA